MQAAQLMPASNAGSKQACAQAVPVAQAQGEGGGIPVLPVQVDSSVM